jgi:TIR domain
MQQATSTAERLVVVLSAAYLQSGHGEAEWRAFYAKDPSGEHGLLLPVRVSDVKPPGPMQLDESRHCHPSAPSPPDVDQLPVLREVRQAVTAYLFSVPKVLSSSMGWWRDGRPEAAAGTVSRDIP